MFTSLCSSFRRAPQPTVKFSDDHAIVYVKFASGERIEVKKESVRYVESTRKHKPVDDGIARYAYDASTTPRPMSLPVSTHCPISKHPMIDPVICADGYSYERSNIQRWLRRSNRSPITNKKMSHSFIMPNHALRSTISELAQMETRESEKENESNLANSK